MVDDLEALFQEIPVNARYPQSRDQAVAVVRQALDGRDEDSCRGALTEFQLQARLIISNRGWANLADKHAEPIIERLKGLARIFAFAANEHLCNFFTRSVNHIEYLGVDDWKNPPPPGVSVTKL